MEVWPCAVWQQIGTAWGQDTYHPGTRRLFHFTPPVAKATVSVRTITMAPLQGEQLSYWGGVKKEVEVGGGEMRKNGRRKGGRNGWEGGVLCTRSSGIISRASVWPIVRSLRHGLLHKRSESPFESRYAKTDVSSVQTGDRVCRERCRRPLLKPPLEVMYVTFNVTHTHTRTHTQTHTGTCTPKGNKTTFYFFSIGWCLHVTVKSAVLLVWQWGEASGKYQGGLPGMCRR